MVLSLAQENLECKRLLGISVVLTFISKPQNYVFGCLLLLQRFRGKTAVLQSIFDENCKSPLRFFREI